MMKYLDCMTMLNHALTLLEAGKRVQVQKTKIPEIVLTLNLVNKNMPDPTSEFQMLMSDTIGGAISVRDMQGIICLSDTMKQTLVSGIESIKFQVASAAFAYYSAVDFEPTPEVIPLMRDVVQTYSDGGGII